MAAVTFKTQMFTLCGSDIVFITSSGCLLTSSIKPLFLLLLHKLPRKQFTFFQIFYEHCTYIFIVLLHFFCALLSCYQVIAVLMSLFVNPVCNEVSIDKMRNLICLIFISFSWRESRHSVHFLTLHSIYKLLYSLTACRHTLTNAQCKWVPGSTSPLIVVLAKALTNRDGGCQDAPCPSSRHSIWRQLIEDAANGSTVDATLVEQLTGLLRATQCTFGAPDPG